MVVGEGNEVVVAEVVVALEVGGHGGSVVTGVCGWWSVASRGWRAAEVPHS